MFFNLFHLTLGDSQSIKQQNEYLQYQICINLVVESTLQFCLLKMFSLRNEKLRGEAVVFEQVTIYMWGDSCQFNFIFTDERNIKYCPAEP